MISPETQTSPRLRRTTDLLKSVAQTSPTSDTPPLATWGLHRIGTDAHLGGRLDASAAGKR